MAHGSRSRALASAARLGVPPSAAHAAPGIGTGRAPGGGWAWRAVSGCHSAGRGAAAAPARFPLAPRPAGRGGHQVRDPGHPAQQRPARGQRAASMRLCVPCAVSPGASHGGRASPPRDPLAPGPLPLAPPTHTSSPGPTTHPQRTPQTLTTIAGVRAAAIACPMSWAWTCWNPPGTPPWNSCLPMPMS